MAAKKAQAQWLTREDVDSVIDAMSAADLIDALGDRDTANPGPKMAGDAFDAAAARIGMSNGTPAMANVRMRDFQYLANRISEAMSTAGPLSEGPTDLQDSATTGE